MHTLNPSFGEFLHDLFHEIVHVDGKIFVSIRYLLTRPGFLSREYFDGRRACYISPIRLYLLFSIFYFALTAFAPPRGLNVSCTSCAPETKAAVEEAMRQAINVWTPRAMFVLIPILAGLVALAMRPARRNFPQHLYFTMHIHSVVFFAGSISNLGGLIKWPYIPTLISYSAGAGLLLYVFLAFRRAYGTTVLRAALSTIFTLSTYMIIVLLSLLVIVMPVVLSRS